MEPLLVAERRRCDKATADLERVKQRLEKFRTEWEPAFSRWFHGKFGESGTRARELEAKAFELNRLITSVEAEAFFSNCSERDAYARMEKIRLGAEKIEEMRSEQQSEESFSGSEADDLPFGKDEEIPPEIEEFLKMGFEQMFARKRFSSAEYAEAFESFKQSFREDVLGQKRASGGEERSRRSEQHHGGHKSAHSRQKPPPKETSEDIRRKQLYRNLVRKLHPDLNKGLNAQELDLWHEVRAAYESKNLETLETLAALVESGGVAGFYIPVSWKYE